MTPYPTHSPAGEACTKGDGPIPTGEGRRYRLRWYHEHCLPVTRLSHIRSFREPDAPNVQEALAIQAKRDAEDMRVAQRRLRAMMEKNRRRG